VRHLHRARRLDNAGLLVVLVYQPDRRQANLLVATQVLADMKLL
jgi:hypothetical protein